jgi:hypothetical protein
MTKPPVKHLDLLGSPAAMKATYVRVLVTQALVLAGLWLLQQAFL